MSTATDTARRRCFQTTAARALEGKRQSEQDARGRRQGREGLPRPPPPSAPYRPSGREWDPLCIPVAGLWPPIRRVSDRHREHTRQSGTEDQLRRRGVRVGIERAVMSRRMIPTTHSMRCSRRDVTSVKILSGFGQSDRSVARHNQDRLSYDSSCDSRSAG